MRRASRMDAESKQSARAQYLISMAHSHQPTENKERNCLLLDVGGSDEEAAHTTCDSFTLFLRSQSTLDGSPGHCNFFLKTIKYYARGEKNTHSPLDNLASPSPTIKWKLLAHKARAPARTYHTLIWKEESREENRKTCVHHKPIESIYLFDLRIALLPCDADRCIRYQTMNTMMASNMPCSTRTSVEFINYRRRKVIFTFTPITRKYCVSVADPPPPPPSPTNTKRGRRWIAMSDHYCYYTGHNTHSSLIHFHYHWPSAAHCVGLNGMFLHCELDHVDGAAAVALCERFNLDFFRSFLIWAGDKRRAERAQLSSADGNTAEEHDQFYRDHKLLLVLFRVLAVMPITRSSPGEWISGGSNVRSICHPN